MGSNFQKVSGVYDIYKNIFLNGIVLLFLFFDMFTSHHIYKYNKIYDISILTFIILFYYLILCLGKYKNIFQPYDFMFISDVRQIIGTGIIIYVLLLNGYIIFDLSAYYFFVNENNEKFKGEDENDISLRHTLYNSDTEILVNHSFKLNDFASHLKEINSSLKSEKSLPVLP